jgi:histidinol-phosphate/aromatic aminotransferase/cobyric acid decarboxylase-like protein
MARLETPDILLAAGVSKPVFDCRWPETRQLAERLWRELPHGLAERLYGQPWRGGQDHLHEEFLDSWLRWRMGVVSLEPSGFPHRYATSGSSEAIRECIAQLAVHARSRSREPVMHVFDGEYEGYGAYADGYAVRIERHDRALWRESLDRRLRDPSEGQLWLISQPSAIDGNLWAELPEFLRRLEEVAPAMRVAVDLAYVGTVARAYDVALTSPLVDTVFFSLSKVFGVYYHRVGGVLSRTMMPGLIGNKWFKNSFSLALGIELLTNLSHHAIPAKYASVQARAAREVRLALGTPLVASDALLIAHHPVTDDLPAAVAGLRRGNIVRYCLTPTIDRLLFRPDSAVPPAGAG